MKCRTNGVKPRKLSYHGFGATDVPFVYSTNGKGFLEHDMKCGVECGLEMDAVLAEIRVALEV